MIGQSNSTNLIRTAIDEPIVPSPTKPMRFASLASIFFCKKHKTEALPSLPRVGREDFVLSQATENFRFSQVHSQQHEEPTRLDRSETQPARPRTCRTPRHLPRRPILPVVTEDRYEALIGTRDIHTECKGNTIILP